MKKRSGWLNILGLGVSLMAVAACGGPVPPAGAPGATPTLVSSPGVVVTLQAPGSAPTALSTATSETRVITAQPYGTIASATPASFVTAAPAVTATRPPGALSDTELKYRLLDQLGTLFYCDPDQYPVARGDLGDLAARTVPAVKQNEPDKYLAILKHLGLDPSAPPSAGQTLAIYQDFKRLNAVVLSPTAETYKFAVRIVDTAANARGGFAVEGTIGFKGDVTVTKKSPAVLQCPICLASDVLIDTPAGPIAVSELQVGMPVWTQDSMGYRVTGVVAQAAHVAVPATHQVVRLRLDDGREVRVSPGHPTADGRRVGELVVGDLLDGSRVVSAAREAYPDGATYDLLPSGESGTYWADGILLGSTLR